MASPSLFKALSLFSIVLAPVAAQTWSACNPMNVTTCPDNPALGTTYNYDFTNPANATTWNATSGTVAYANQGGQFTINKRYDSPTIQSEFYIMFGVVEVHMRAAPGQGIISSIVLESDDLDEVDWEFMGGNNTHAETNYFGKGNTTLYNRAIYYPVETPTDLFHNYTVHWTKDAIEWYIDTNLVRTLHYADALGGYNFPQTPMNIRLGIWAGGDPSLNNGTIEWAGGLTDFTKGPYTMYVKSIKVQDYGTGKAYHWADKTGSYTSIKSVAGNSTALTTLTAPPPAASETISQKWSNLSSGVRIGIYAAGGAFAVAMAGLITFCCIKQRRAGRKEAAAYSAKMEQDREEAESFAMDNKAPDSLPSSATPNQFNSNGTRIGDPYYEKPGQFGSGQHTPSPPPSYAGLNNAAPGSPSGSNAYMGLPNGARSPPPGGPLPTPGNQFNHSPSSPYQNQNSPYDQQSPNFVGGGMGMGNMPRSNTPGSMRPGNGPPNFYNQGPNGPNGPNGPMRTNTGGFSDFGPTTRSASAQGGPPRNFNNSPAPSSPYSDQPRMMSPGPRGGPGPMNGNSGPRNFTAPGGYSSPPPQQNFSDYGNGGLRSPQPMHPMANNGMVRGPGSPTTTNFSRPDRSQSPYGPPGGQGGPQFGGSSGGSYFNNGGYGRAGQF